MNISQTTDKDYFDKLYEATVDPFRNWQNDYETSKRAKALSLLSRTRYSSAFEPGCGNGALSLDLSARCERLVSVDWSADALKAAALHCAGIPHITFREMDFPVQWPSDDFDLMVVSELLYYFSDARLEALFEALPRIVKPGGEVMLIHWRGLSDDYPSSGDMVHERFHDLSHIKILNSFEHPQYLISSGLVQ